MSVPVWHNISYSQRRKMHEETMFLHLEVAISNISNFQSDVCIPLFVVRSNPVYIPQNNVDDFLEN